MSFTLVITGPAGSGKTTVAESLVVVSTPSYSDIDSITLEGGRSEAFRNTRPCFIDPEVVAFIDFTDRYIDKLPVSVYQEQNRA